MALLLVAALSFTLWAAPEVEVDVAVVGATPAGIAAAINAARNGAVVALVEPSEFIGGMATSGVSHAGFRSFEAAQGTFREFMNGVVSWYTRKYGANAQQVKDCQQGAAYEPSVATAVFEQMLAREKRLRVYRNLRLHAVTKIPSGAKGQSTLHTVTFQSPRTGLTTEVAADVFIDATYEGDLLAMAGVRYVTGRESVRQYGERFAGSVYASDGRILPGSSGQGDKRVQRYDFRLCLTRNAANRVRLQRPMGYRREEFLPLAAAMARGEIEALDGGIYRLHPLPNQKADAEQVASLPTGPHPAGLEDEWPEGDASVRARIFQAHRLHAVSLLYFLQNDPDTPAAIRNQARQWGLARDEYRSTGNLPPALYVREARRMVGAFVFTEQMTQPAADSVRAPLQPDAVAVGDFPLGCRGERAPTSYHPGSPDGAFTAEVAPFQIPYRVMLPRELDNLLTPVAASASHVGGSALRTEPVRASLGQAAGIAAAIAAARHIPVQRVPPSEIQQRLWRARAATIYFSDVPPGSPEFERVQRFGSLGYFHHVVDRDGVTYAAPRSLRGGWTEAYPHHAAELHKPMNDELAERWARMAGLKELPEDLEEDSLTRGQFLSRLEKRLP